MQKQKTRKKQVLNNKSKDMSSFADKIKQQQEEAQKEGIATSNTGDWYKLQENDNVIRVLEEPEMIFEKFKVGICYTDCGYEGTPKFLTYVLDRKDGKIKLAKLPYKIGTTIATYQEDDDYAFDGFPMDYDIKVHAKNAGTTDVIYTMTPRPKRERIDSETAAALLKLKRIPEIIAKMKENKKNEHIADGTWDANQKRKQDIQAGIEEAKANARGSQDYPEEEINPDDIPF